MIVSKGMGLGGSLVFRGTKTLQRQSFVLCVEEMRVEGRNSIMQYKECWTWDLDSVSSSVNLDKYVTSLNFRFLSNKTRITALLTSQDHVFKNSYHLMIDTVLCVLYALFHLIFTITKTLGLTMCLQSQSLSNRRVWI